MLVLAAVVCVRSTCFFLFSTRTNDRGDGHCGAVSINNKCCNFMFFVAPSGVSSVSRRVKTLLDPSHVAGGKRDSFEAAQASRLLPCGPREHGKGCLLVVDEQK